jgi:DNA polymerase-3 subunit epsilon
MEQKVPTLAFLDVETTGLSPEHDDRICEIAVLRTAGAAPQEWQTLVNPGRVISPGATAINGITNEMVAAAPHFPEVAPRLLELLEGAVVVCHNAPFDLGFIAAELAACGRTLPRLPVIDTLRLARRYFNFSSNTLGNIAATLDIDVREKHRAMADVMTMYHVFNHFWHELSQQGIASLDELHTPDAWAPQRRSSTRGAFHLPPVLEEAMRARKSVRICYLSGSGRSTRRVITPLRVISRFDSLYLEAFCSLRNEQRTFRLDRIINFKVLA